MEALHYHSLMTRIAKENHDSFVDHQNHWKKRATVVII